MASLHQSYPRELAALKQGLGSCIVIESVSNKQELIQIINFKVTLSLKQNIHKFIIHSKNKKKLHIPGTCPRHAQGRYKKS